MSTEYRSRKCLLNLSFFKVLMIVFYTDYIYKTTTAFLEHDATVPDVLSQGTQITTI